MVGDVSHIESFDGFILPYRSWLPPGEEPRAVLVALHGFNDHSNFCRGLAPELTDAGVAIYAYDQRGFGQTDDDGFWPGEERLAGDLAFFTEFIRKSWPGVPLVVMGESMGGAVVVLAATSVPEERGGVRMPRFTADRLVLSAPAVWARHLQPWHHQLSLSWMRAVMPGASLPCNLARRMVAQSPELLQDLKEDPLVRAHCSVEMLAGVVDMMDSAWKRAPLLGLPTLILQGRKDDVIPEHTVTRFWESMAPRKENRLLLYRDGRHMLPRDLGGEDVVHDLLDWIVEGKIEEFSSRNRDVLKPAVRDMAATNIDMRI